jgi:hypothetical protein
LKDYMLFNDGEEDWLLFIILFLCAISIKYLFFHSEGDEVICVCVYNIVKVGSTNFVYLNITVYLYVQSKPVLCDLLNRVTQDRWSMNTGLFDMKYTVKGN